MNAGTTITLWHLLRRCRAEERAQVYRVLQGLVRGPRDITDEAVIKLDPLTLELWFNKVSRSWRSCAIPIWKRVYRELVTELLHRAPP